MSAQEPAPEPEVADTRFSHHRGFYSEAFEVAINSETPGAEIRYTLDGSAPSPDHGLRYAGPIAIDTTTVLRAMTMVLESGTRTGEAATTMAWSYPGAGTASTRQWRAGDRYRDTWSLEAPPAPWGPRLAQLGVLAFVGAGSDGGGIGESGSEGDVTRIRTLEGEPVEWPLAAEIPIRPVTLTLPAQPAMMAEQPIFGESIQLIASEINRVAEGDRVVLWWRALGELEGNPTVFFHVIDENGTKVAQADGPPQSGESPVSIWRAEDVIIDRRVLGVPAEGAGTAVSVRLGFYDAATGVRFPAILDDERLKDDAYILDLASRPVAKSFEWIEAERRATEQRAAFPTPEGGYPSPDG